MSASRGTNKPMTSWQQTSLPGNPGLIPPSFVPLLSRRGLWTVPGGGEGPRQLDEALPGGQHLRGADQYGQEGAEAVPGGTGCHELGPRQAAGQVRHVLHGGWHGVCLPGEPRISFWFWIRHNPTFWKEHLRDVTNLAYKYTHTHAQWWKSILSFLHYFLPLESFSSVHCSLFHLMLWTTETDDCIFQHTL